MIIECTACKAQFTVDVARLSPQGGRARCSNCSVIFSIPAPVASADLQPQDFSATTSMLSNQKLQQLAETSTEGAAAPSVGDFAAPTSMLSTQALKQLAGQKIADGSDQDEPTAVRGRSEIFAEPQFAATTGMIAPRALASLAASLEKSDDESPTQAGPLAAIDPGFEFTNLSNPSEAGGRLLQQGHRDDAEEDRTLPAPGLSQDHDGGGVAAQRRPPYSPKTWAFVAAASGCLAAGAVFAWLADSVYATPTVSQVRIVRPPQVTYAALSHVRSVLYPTAQGPAALVVTGTVVAQREMALDIVLELRRGPTSLGAQRLPVGLGLELADMLRLDNHDAWPEFLQGAQRNRAPTPLVPNTPTPFVMAWTAPPQPLTGVVQEISLEPSLPPAAPVPAAAPAAPPPKAPMPSYVEDLVPQAAAPANGPSRPLTSPRPPKGKFLHRARLHGAR